MAAVLQAAAGGAPVPDDQPPGGGAGAAAAAYPEQDSQQVNALGFDWHTSVQSLLSICGVAYPGLPPPPAALSPEPAAQPALAPAGALPSAGSLGVKESNELGLTSLLFDDLSDGDSGAVVLQQHHLGPALPALQMPQQTAATPSSAGAHTAC